MDCDCEEKHGALPSWVIKLIWAFFILAFLAVCFVGYVIFRVPNATFDENMQAFDASAANSMAESYKVNECAQRHSVFMCDWWYTFDKDKFETMRHQ